MFGVPPNTLPLVMYIGIVCYWVSLHYNMSFKTIPGSFTAVFLWYRALSEDREFFLLNPPKLSCGFNRGSYMYVHKPMVKFSGASQKKNQNSDGSDKTIHKSFSQFWNRDFFPL